MTDPLWLALACGGGAGWLVLGVILTLQVLDWPRTSRQNLHQYDIILFLLWCLVTLAGVAGWLA